MFDFLRKFDAFPKALDDFRVKTTTGATVSILSFLLIIFLFFSELSFYYQKETVDHLYVNTTIASNLKVDFDFSFPEISCSLLSMDAADATGNPQANAVHNIFKYKIDNQGNRMSHPERHILGNTITSEKQLAVQPHHSSEKMVDCGDCYGSKPPGHCCNTCQDVKDGYASMGWRFIPQGIVQCESEAAIQTLEDQFAEDGGCRIFGTLHLHHSTGNFHIAPHKTIQEKGQNALGFFSFFEFLNLAFNQFNITHTINRLSFGDQYPGYSSPLDSQSRTIEDTHGMYQYYLKIVPTKYKHANGREVESNQYAVTEHLRHLTPGSGRGLPGLYFFYEISPVSAVFEEREAGFFRFLTSVCAIIGGAYTVMGMVDSFITYGLRFMKKEVL